MAHRGTGRIGVSKRVLSGIQPTHDSFHLGNYLGALTQWVELQSTHDAYYCIVDLHALTIEVDPALLRKRILASAAQLLAIGIDPKKSTLFIQSHVPAHNQLGWVFECITGFGEANRMLDTPEANIKKIKSAVTDTGREVTFDEKEKPGISNLLSIFSAITGRTVKSIESDYAGKGYGDFKKDVAEVVTEALKPIRETALAYLKDESALLELLREGADRAEAVAGQTISTVYNSLGLLPRKK